jgi:hypothetical protein
MLHLLTNQITHIMVDIDIGKRKISNKNESNLFEFILLNSTHLNDLNFLQKSSDKYLTLSSLHIQNRTFQSSTLTKLTINVNNHTYL